MKELPLFVEEQRNPQNTNPFNGIFLFVREATKTENAVWFSSDRGLLDSAIVHLVVISQLSSDLADLTTSLIVFF
jgi:hypothetical protein